MQTLVKDKTANARGYHFWFDLAQNAMSGTFSTQKKKSITSDMNCTFRNSVELVITRLAIGNKIICRIERFC